MAVVGAYGTMFLLVVVFLNWFQVEDASFHWTSLLGYYATVVLMGATLWIARDRLQKRDQIHKHSDLADWLFIGLLFLTSLTGILLHLFRLLNLPMATYVSYTIHLMVAVPMLVIEVPVRQMGPSALSPAGPIPGRSRGAGAGAPGHAARPRPRRSGVRRFATPPGPWFGHPINTS